MIPKPVDRSCSAIPRPHQSPGLTPLDFVWKGAAFKDRMYLLHFPSNLPELRNRIETAAAEMIYNVMVINIQLSKISE